MVSLAILLMIVGTAGPQWGLDWNQSVDPGRDVIVVLDLSRSMLAENPSRLQMAKQALIDLSTSEVIEIRPKFYRHSNNRNKETPHT